MNRKIASALLLTQWLLSLWLLVFFPSRSMASQDLNHRQPTLETGNQFVVDHGILPGSQDIETDPKWPVSTPPAAEKITLVNPNQKPCLNPIYQDSIPLFDIKITFSHYFHTW